MRFRPAVPAAIAVIVSCTSLTSGAQTATSSSSTGLEEITVTAQRREERLSDVPMSIAAISQADLDQRGLKDIDDLTRVTPGITFIRNGTAGSFNDEQSNVSIRGVYSTAGAATTGLYIDDTPIQTRHLSYGSADPYPELFDLDRVEVLRGPQGTLFGGGSEGGTIRFIRPEPSLTTDSGYVRSEVASIDKGGLNYEGGGAFGGPIIPDVLGFRASIFYREDGGWIDRDTYVTEPTAGNPIPMATGTMEKNANWHDVYVGNVALKWSPSDTLTVQPALFVQSLHINDTGMYWVALSNWKAAQYATGNIGRDSSTDPFYLASLKINWTLPFGDLVSNTSYFHRKESAISDYTQWLNTNYLANVFPTAAQLATTYESDNQNNVTEELRLNSRNSGLISWTGGIFLSRVYEDQPEVTVDASYAGLIGSPPVPGNIVDYQPTFNTTDKQVAAFGELGVKLTDELKVTAGVRAAHVQYSGYNVESGLLVGPSIDSYNSANENPVTPRLVVSYQTSVDSLYYASASKGYRPGGLNTTLPSVCTENLPIKVSPTFNSDSLWQYEVGTKQTLFERRLQLDASVYYLKWKNIQQLTFLPCGLGFTPNLGEVTGRGGDIHTVYKATEDLTVGVDAAYTDSYYPNGQTIQAGATPVTILSSGDHLPSSPWNIDLNAEYVVSTMAKKPYLRADYQYATAQNSLIQGDDPRNTGSDPTLRSLPMIRVMALRAGVRFDGYDISAFAQNAFNFNTPTFYYRDSQLAVDTNYFYRGVPPRTIGVTGSYRF